MKPDSRRGAPRARAPRSDGVRSRKALVRAAIEVLGEGNSDNPGVREIAARAGVDPALVRRYFGSKEGLVIAALDEVRQEFDLTPVIRNTEVSGLGFALAKSALARRHNGAPLQFFLRGATSLMLAPMVNERVLAEANRQIRDALPGRNSAARASAILGILTGAATARHLFNLESTRGPAFVNAVGASIQAVIDEY